MLISTKYAEDLNAALKSPKPALGLAFLRDEARPTAAAPCIFAHTSDRLLLFAVAVNMKSNSATWSDVSIEGLATVASAGAPHELSPKIHSWISCSFCSITCLPWSILNELAAAILGSGTPSSQCLSLTSETKRLHSSATALGLSP